MGFVRRQITVPAAGSPTLFQVSGRQIIVQRAPSYAPDAAPVLYLENIAGDGLPITGAQQFVFGCPFDRFYIKGTPESEGAVIDLLIADDPFAYQATPAGSSDTKTIFTEQVATIGEIASGFGYSFLPAEFDGVPGEVLGWLINLTTGSDANTVWRPSLWNLLPVGTGGRFIYLLDNVIVTSSGKYRYDWGVATTGAAVDPLLPIKLSNLRTFMFLGGAGTNDEEFTIRLAMNVPLAFTTSIEDV